MCNFDNLLCSSEEYFANLFGEKSFCNEFLRELLCVVKTLLWMSALDAGCALKYLGGTAFSFALSLYCARELMLNRRNS